jgi:hypothetical protein
MKRIIVFGHAARGGPFSCSDFADRLADRLHLKRLHPESGTDRPRADEGWITISRLDQLSEELLRSADTAIWLNYSPRALLREWRSRKPGDGPGLVEVLAALSNAFTAPRVHDLARTLAHVNFHELRSRDQASFWLRAQEHRLADPDAARLVPA